MAKTEGDQNIPAGYAWIYDGTLRPSTNTWKWVQKRAPFKIGRMQNGGGGVTYKQLYQRSLFTKSVKCYNCQPYNGGVIPPEIGPRNRSWWYDDALGSGLWYYDYFMQQTLDSYVASTNPPWCYQEMPDGGLQGIVQRHPNNSFWNRDYVQVGGKIGDEYIAFGKCTNNAFPFCHTWDLGNTLVVNNPTYTLKIYRVLGDWDPLTLTWNNHPPIMQQVSEVVVPLPAHGHNIKIPIPEDITSFCCRAFKQQPSPVWWWRRVGGGKDGYAIMAP